MSSALYSGWGFDDPVVAQAPAPVTTGEGSEELIDDLARESDLTCTLQEKWLAANPCLSPLASPWVSRLALLTEQLEAALQGAI